MKKLATCRQIALYIHSNLFNQRLKIDTKCCHIEGFYLCDQYTIANYFEGVTTQENSDLGSKRLIALLLLPMALFCDHSSWNKNLKREYHLASLSTHHSGMQVAQACLENVSLHQFWFIANDFPDLVCRLHVQITLMGNCGLNGGISWLSNTDGANCFFCKKSIEDVSNFFFDCSEFKANFESVWANLNPKVMSSNSIDGAQIPNSINSLDREQKALLLLGGLCLPFDQATATLTTILLSTAVSKIYPIRLERLRELWPHGFPTNLNLQFESFFVKPVFFQLKFL